MLQYAAGRANPAADFQRSLSKIDAALTSGLPGTIGLKSTRVQANLLAALGAECCVAKPLGKDFLRFWTVARFVGTELAASGIL
jgi:hypothetical protein